MSSCNSPPDLRKHYERLRLVNSEGASGFDEEFNYIEKKSSDESFFGDYTSAHKPFNRVKNRYANVLPLEDTRVVLNGLEGYMGADYINANFVSGKEKGDRSYISTQGPLEATAADFWRMVWEQKVRVIVMLTRLVENGRTKCYHYYPKNSEKKKTFSESGHTFEVVLLNKTKRYHLIERTIKLVLIDSPHESLKIPRIIHHFQYTEWPDHGLPESTATFRELLTLVDLYNNENNNNESLKSSDSKIFEKETSQISDYEDEESDDEESDDEEEKKPVVVHCSAGIGRTGTFCTVHSILSKLSEYRTSNNIPYPDLDILNRILQLRKERIGMVQTKDQYEFCYRTILEALEEITEDQDPREKVKDKNKEFE